MSGSGSAPQLDERALEAATKNVLASGSTRPPKEGTYQRAQRHAEAAVRAYLAAVSGAGELDLTDGEVEAILRNLPDEPGFHLGFGGNFNAAVAKLRARLDAGTGNVTRAFTPGGWL